MTKKKLVFQRYEPNGPENCLHRNRQGLIISPKGFFEQKSFSQEQIFETYYSERLISILMLLQQTQQIK